MKIHDAEKTQNGYAIIIKHTKMPHFETGNKIYFKRSTLIVEKNIVKKVFYPIFPPNKHINEVLQWLKEN